MFACGNAAEILNFLKRNVVMKPSRHLPLALLLLISAWVTASAHFIAPAEGPVAFRRDQIRLDSDEIVVLAQQLEALARANPLSSAPASRQAAQLIALSTALDPSNKNVRYLIVDLQLGNHNPQAETSSLLEFRAAILRTIRWLETESAGAASQALAKCLTDVVMPVDSKNSQPLVEQGAWQEWVPSVAVYAAEELQSPSEKNSQPDAKSPNVADELALQAAQVSTVLWIRDSTQKPPGKVSLGSGILEMKAQRLAPEQVENMDFVITIMGANHQPEMAELVHSLINLLGTRQPKLPRGWQVMIGGEDLKKSLTTEKPQCISAAAAVLASAAITGREPDATILGLVDEAGVLTLPANFWDQLDSLASSGGKRLILPAAAAEILPAMLALERPGFFFDHEVVLATNFQEMCDLAAKKLDDSARGSSQKFQEIRSKWSSQSVGGYVANTYVRKRLEDIVRQTPNHFSARMLAIQGAGNRPSIVPKQVMLQQLARVVESLGSMIRQGNLQRRPAAAATLLSLNDTYEKSRLELLRLERLVDKSERKLFSEVQQAVELIRPLERALKSRSYDYAAYDNLGVARNNLINSHAALADEMKLPAALPSY
jgi:hypothetical protein